jgi:hypothetical protein
MNLFARGVKVVFGKELIDGLRDRRAITSAMFGVFIGPLMIVAMFNLIIDQQRDSDQIEVPVAGAERAAPLIDWMKQQYGVKIVDAPADPQQAVRDGKVHLVLVIREDFAKRFSEAPTRLVRRVGLAWAKEMVLTGARLDAETAQRIGLVNRIFPHEELVDRAVSAGGDIAAKGPLAVAAAKRVMQEGRDADLRLANALEQEAFARGFASHDRAEGMTAFLEKRDPKFEGR